ncbi:glutamine cyclotransferase [Candidatus Marinamargulisbacteria bacterium SCGC AG-410-N11]|nr:glutamine cyclotransferase [Candidatus Marinamargulisbacteria bacterium SCGC AG-410-N11]
MKQITLSLIFLFHFSLIIIGEYKVDRLFKHKKDMFTQGLFYYQGYLYESSGLYGRSKLIKYDYTSGKVVQEVSISSNFYGEGIALWKNKIIMLTWKSNKGLVFDLETLDFLNDFFIPFDGWGLASLEDNLIASNGSNELFIIDPNSFKVSSTVLIKDFNNKPLVNINELEYVNGYLYANIWKTNRIVKIDLSKKQVVSDFIFDDLIDTKVNRNRNYVLNGIAFNSDKNTFFITGKCWSYLYECILK